MSSRSEEDDSPTVIDPQKYRDVPPLIEYVDGTKITLQGNGKTYELTMGKRLGRGGFGTVYKCKDSSGNEYAIKKVSVTPDKNKGIPCLFEASMMNSYTHPSLNKAIATSATSTCLYILQDVAKYDLHGLMREKGLNGSKLDISQLKNILYRVVKGMSYLHSKGLVHGDIKCGNVLFFSDNDIRITDYNLTTMKKWQSSIHLCTAIYRPLEIWMEKTWSEKIDIWSFGCMMYELLYENILFLHQGEGNKKDIKRRYINAILDWANFNSPGKLKMDRYNLAYKSPNIDPNLLSHKSDDIMNRKKESYDYNKECYINLMLRCLQVLERDRPQIDTVLADQFFLEQRSRSDLKELFNISDRNKVSLNRDFYSVIERSMENYVEKKNSELLKLATYICFNYAQLTNHDTHLTKKVSVWIAKKLLRIDTKSQEVPNTDGNITREQLLKKEIEICDKLGFRLHAV